MLPGDFYIVDVKYDPETELARELKVSEPFNFRPGPACWVDREQVIGMIEDGFLVESLPTIFRMLLKRLLIKVVEVNGKKYLRTDSARIPADFIIRSQAGGMVRGLHG